MIEARRTPIGKLITTKERPETTLTLLTAIKEQKKHVGSFVFTDYIRMHFEKILESVATGKAQGFWITAQYGAGKTHFLTTLSALLSDTSEDLWKLVQDDEIQNYRPRLQNVSLFPIVLSLRGETGVADSSRTLLDVMEGAIKEALSKWGLQDDISITSAEETYKWYKNLSAELRAQVDLHIKKKTALTPDECINEGGLDKLADLIQNYCSENHLRPEVTSSIKERIRHVYQQITNIEDGRLFNGLLFVIDEFASWQESHPQNTPGYTEAEDVLETLAYLLPQEENLSIYTIVASQKEVPVKLRGSGSSARFIDIPLLSSLNERDYDIIVAKRIRDINSEMIPEINTYYEYYYHNFQFMNGVLEQEFTDIFPFQRRSFEVLRRITAMMATARVGINVLYEVLVPSPYSAAPINLLESDSLITVADLLNSSDLQTGLNETPLYKEAYRAYNTALKGLETIDLDTGQDALARRIIGTLFLWYLAYMDAPRSMSIHELAEATLTVTDVIKADDQVRLVLSKIRDLGQITYSKEAGVSFVAQTRIIPGPQIFSDTKQKIANPPDMDKSWRESLFIRPENAVGEITLFSEYAVNVAASQKCYFRKVEYDGKVIVTDQWNGDLGQVLTRDDGHFRIVILTEYCNVLPTNIQDERIAVCIPAELSEKTRESAREYLAIEQMREHYRTKVGAEADQIRDWINGKRPELIRNLITTQVPQFKSGKIVTRSQLNIPADEVFISSGSRKQLDRLAAIVVGNVYNQSPVKEELMLKIFNPSDAGKLFTGMFHNNAKPADRSAADNFAAGLGLARPENRRKFDPLPLPVFDYFREKLEEHKGHVQAWQIFDELTNIPWGMTQPLVALYLVSFVRLNNPTVDIYLKPNHNLVLQSGQKPFNNRLTYAVIPELEWKSKIYDSFDTLSKSEGPSWDDMVNFAQLVKPELRTTNDPAVIESQ